MKNVKYGFVFDFKDGGWNMIMFKEDGEYHKYYSCDEDDYDNSFDHLADYVSDSSMIRTYKIPTYDEFCGVIDDDRIFNLPNEDIAEFEQYKR